MARPFPEPVQSWHDELLGELSRLDSDLEEPLLERAKKAVAFCTEALQKLRQYFLENGFENFQDEIRAFKYLKPAFHHLLIYQRAIFQIELKTPPGSRKIKRKYYDQQLKYITDFFRQQADLYSYYRNDDTFLDELYFLRKSGNPELDPIFCSLNDYVISQILANEKLQRWLEKAKSDLDGRNEELSSGKRSLLRWTASKASLVELLYAIQQTGVCNHGQAELKLLAQTFEQLFQVDLGNYYGIFNELRLRKKNRTPLLDEMKMRLLGRMDELDER